MKAKPRNEASPDCTAVEDEVALAVVLLLPFTDHLSRLVEDLILVGIFALDLDRDDAWLLLGHWIVLADDGCSEVDRVSHHEQESIVAFRVVLGLEADVHEVDVRFGGEFGLDVGGDRLDLDHFDG